MKIEKITFERLPLWSAFPVDGSAECKAKILVAHQRAAIGLRKKQNCIIRRQKMRSLLLLLRVETVNHTAVFAFDDIPFAGPHGFLPVGSAIDQVMRRVAVGICI